MNFQNLMLQLIELFYKFSSSPIGDLTKLITLFLSNDTLENSFFESLMVSAPNAEYCDECKKLKVDIQLLFSAKRQAIEHSSHEMLNQLSMLNR